MKKLLSILLTLALCVGLMSAVAVPVHAATATVNVAVTDVADGEMIEGAILQIYKQSDTETVLWEWPSTEEEHQVTGLETDVEYVLHESVAPAGYILASDTTFTIDEYGTITSTGTMTLDNTLLVENAKTSVSIKKVKAADNTVLTGATLQIQDPDGNIVEEWVSGTDAHIVTGLLTETTYTIKETVAPEEYETAADSTFTISTSGTISYSGATETESGALLVKNELEPVKYDLWIAGIQVTERNLVIDSADNANITSGNATYDVNSKTLTLNGFTFNGDGHTESFAYNELYNASPAFEAIGAIFSKLDDLTITLSGNSDVTEADSDYVNTGIFSTGTITINGSGKLNVTGGSSNLKNLPYLSGIYTKDLIINGGSISSTGGNSHRYSGAAITNGLFVFNEFTVNDGTIYAVGGESDYWSYGGQCGTTTINGGNVTIQGGNGSNSYGLFGNYLQVYGGELTLLVKSSTNAQRALGNQARTFGPGVSVIASKNMDGSEAVDFFSMNEPANNAKYVKTTYTPLPGVTITPGSNMTKTTDSGEASQADLAGAMTDVVFTADDGYYFPDPYSSAGTITGVTVTRDSYTQITVSGTPTANTTINLDPATAKTKLPTPTVTFALTGDSDLEISGLIDGTTYRIGFPDGGSADYTVSGSKLTLSGIVAGNYSIKALAAGSAANEHIDSDAVQETITKAAAPTGVGKTDCTTGANNDATITGVDNTMEYQKSGDTAWTPVTGTSVTDLVPGTYSVRIASAGTALASDAVSVTIAEYTVPKADAPIFTPANGTTFTESLDVTISIPAGATVYYTDDGSDPSATNGTVTTGAAITLTETKTLKAIAVMAGYDDSDIATATYTKKDPSPTPSSGGGSTPAPETYAVTPGSAENGKITVSPKDAAEGDKVTVTVTPDEGYELDALTVKDKDGNEIKVTEKDGVYTFMMPASEVDIEAAFKAAEEEPAPSDEFPFEDVPEDAYFRKPVEWAVEKGITSGVSEDKYGPELSCTRAQVVTFLWITCGSEDAGTETGFDDVDVDAYYDKAVAWAVEKGITAGTSEDEFSPEMIITRAQFVTMLWVAQGKPEADGDMPFTDVPEDAYYAKAVAWAYANDITAGKSADSFAPEDPCTRGQIMTFLYNAYGE